LIHHKSPCCSEDTLNLNIHKAIKQTQLPFVDRNMIAGFLAAQRFALPACGRAAKMPESRESPKPEKCLKMPQNPTRQVHALLGGHFA
jgi:hypothetical protein